MTPRKLSTSLLLALAIAVVATWYWLLHTESGARFAWNRATAAMPDSLSATDVSGDLGSGLQFDGFAFESQGLRITIQQLHVTVDVDIVPLSIAVNGARASDMMVEVIATDGGDAQAADPAKVLDSLQLPVRLMVNDLKIADAVIRGVSEDDLVIDDVALSAGWKDELRVDQLVVNSPLGRADLVAALDFWRPYNLRLSGDLSVTPALTGLQQTVTLTNTIRGDLGSASVEFSLQPYSARVAGEVSNLLTQPNWDLTLDAESLSWPLDGGADAIRIAALAAQSDGRIDGYALTASAVVATPQLDATNVNVAGTGTTTSIIFEQLRVASDDLDLAGVAAVDWSDELDLVAQLVVARANINAFSETWPASRPLSGSVNMQLNKERIALRDTQLQIGDTSAWLRADGELNFATSVVDGTLAWQDLQWPIVADTPTVSSRSGKIVASGSLQDWRVAGDIELATAGVGDSSFTIDGGGDENSADLNIQEGALLGGLVSGTAAYSWRDAQPYTVSLNVKGVQTETFFADWPAVLSGQVRAQGNASPFRIEAQLQDIYGELRGRPLTLDGDLTYSDDVFLADGLQATHGASRLSLDGDAGTEDGFAFSLALDDLGVYLPEAAGALVADGRLSLARGSETLRLSATSDSLRYGDIELVDVAITDRGGPAEILDLDARIDTIVVGGDSINSIEGRLTATQDAQDLSLAARYGSIAASLSLQGAFDNWREARTWRGDLTDLTLQLGDKRLLKLNEATPLLLSQDRVSLERGCIADDTGSTLCADVSWGREDMLRFSATLQELRVNTVNVLADTGFEFNQVLSGDIDWSQQRGKRLTGAANLKISAGQIRSLSQDHVVRTAPGAIKFAVADGELLSGNVFLPMPGTGSISGTFSVLDIAAGTASPIQGDFGIGMNAIDVLAVISPLIDRAEGSLTAGVRVSGTLADPSVFGSVDLKDVGLDYLPIGLQLDDVDLRADLLEDQSLTVKGTFRAGEGTGEIESEAELRSADAGIRLRLLGDNLRVISVPDVTAVADMNVGIEYRNNQLTLNGDVLVPWARVTPQDIASRKLSESADVVVVKGELPDSDVARKESNLKLFGEMHVAFGEDVEIQLDLAKARLTGATTFRWSGDVMPKAQGRYDLSGDIEAYGQALKVVEGAIRFPQVSADNPEIRIRAEREIYGNTQVKQAGVLVAGTAKRPTLQAYTVPMTTEERALTLLVTGSDFDFEQGVGAIDFGTYIAPRLFISYGIGLFDQENVISARYDLARGFGIKATSGQKESGVDFIYRIER